MFEQAFKNIDDVLWKEAGCGSELDYAEQTSWLLFLKYLDGLEQDRSMEAELEGKTYTFILDEPYHWESWAAPKTADGKLDHNKALTGDDLRDFVDRKLFPYLHGFKQKASGPNTIEYKIGEIFGEIKNKIHSGYPFIQTGDIRNSDHFITEYSQTYSEAGLAQSKLWPKGTICITIAANIAETGILDFDACFPDSVIGVVANPEEANVDYVEYLLQSFKVHIQAMGKGSAQANINMGTFENERFPFPAVSEQKQIVEKLNSLREETQRLESIYLQKLTALNALKKSLLDQAFTGQLQEPNHDQ
jgi:hypothetical protein